jgi:hypothetical protein
MYYYLMSGRVSRCKLIGHLLASIVVRGFVCILCLTEIKIKTTLMAALVRDHAITEYISRFFLPPLPLLILLMAFSYNNRSK